MQRFVKGASGTGRDLGIDDDDDDDEDEEAQLRRDADNTDKDLTLTELVAKATEVAQEAAKNSAISGGEAGGKAVPFFRGEKVSLNITKSSEFAAGQFLPSYAPFLFSSSLLFDSSSHLHPLSPHIMYNWT